MVIECAHCQARFKLADDKLKSEGTKVRCSKCKEIFTVFPPTDEAPALPAATPPAAPPPAPAAPAPPAAAQPTVPADQIDFGELTLASPPAAPSGINFPANATASSANAAPPSGGGFELEDIAQSASGGFTAVSAAASAGTGSLAADTFSSPAESESGGFGEFNFDNSPSIPLSTASGDSNADFGNFDFDNTAATASPAVAEASPPSDPFSFDQTPSGDFDFGDSPATPPAPPPPPASGAKDDFDFSGMSFGDENATQVMKAPTAPAPSPRTAAPEVPPRQEPPEQRPAAPQRPNREGRSKPLGTPLPRPRRHFSVPIGRILTYLAVFLIFGTGGAAVFFYLKPGLFDTRKMIDDMISRSTAPKIEEGQIRIANYSGSFVTGAGGDFFVIRGEATNDFKSPRSGLAVKATLYDEKGAALRSQIAFCGNPISDETLRRESFKTFETSMANQFGESLANIDVAPGKTLTFTVVFPSLPGISAFTVEFAETPAAVKPQ